VEFDVPVIVVGNVTVGGTGKTPLVIWLAERLRERGYRPGIVCRGYGGRAAVWPQRTTADSDALLVGDESVVLARRARCPVVAAPDRVAAVRFLLANDGVDVVLSDDGLQHYRLGRAVEIAVVDGTRGLGNGLCLPAGPLRETPLRLREVDAIVVNGGDWGHAGVFRADLVATGVRQTTTGAMKALADFEGKHVHAVAGIGNPERFFALLEDHGLVVERHALPDHAIVRAEDLRFAEGDAVMITEKDEVKCRELAHADVWCVLAEMHLAAQDAERLLRILVRHLDKSSA
jgi:tetraacyldisaccharide 4'-kinase